VKSDILLIKKKKKDMTLVPNAQVKKRGQEV
jgi:hypothetical protein